MFQFSRSEFENAPRERLNRKRLFHCDVYLVEANDRKYVVKDYCYKLLPVKWLIGVPVIWNEHGSMARLQDTGGVPPGIHKIDRYCMAMEFVESQKISRFKDSPGCPVIIERLGKLIDEMYSLGVVHMDLRHSSNLIVTEDLRPILIDFGTAWIRRGWLFGFDPIFYIGRKMDISSVVKWKVKLCPQLADESELSAHRWAIVWSMLFFLNPTRFVRNLLPQKWRPRRPDHR
ncbi:RIO1 family regulatory kinase/ATPase [Candidatus Hydrogenedentota bacterium]